MLRFLLLLERSSVYKWYQGLGTILALENVNDRKRGRNSLVVTGGENKSR